MNGHVDSPSFETNIEYELPATNINSEGDTAAFQWNDMSVSKITLGDDMPNLEDSSFSDLLSSDTSSLYDTSASESSTQTTDQAPKVEFARYPQWIENHVILGRDTRYPNRFSDMTVGSATEDGVTSFAGAFECDGRLVEECIYELRIEDASLAPAQRTWHLTLMESAFCRWQRKSMEEQLTYVSTLWSSRIGNSRTSLRRRGLT